MPEKNTGGAHAAEAHRICEQAVVLARDGQVDESESLLRQALIINPSFAMGYIHLASLLRQRGHEEEVVTVLQALTRHCPDLSAGHNRLGQALRATGALQQAVEAYQQALSLEPDHAETHYNLGNALQDMDRFDEALAAYFRACDLKPALFEATLNLGLLLTRLNRFDDAVDVLRNALRLHPTDAGLQKVLADALVATERWDDVVAIAREVVDTRPDEIQSWLTEAQALRKLGHFAVVARRLATGSARNPESAELATELGLSLSTIARHDSAVKALQRVVELQPDRTKPGSNLLMALQYADGIDGEALSLEHRAWALRYGLDNPPTESGVEAIDTTRPLRVGFVSSFFYEQALAFFFLPALEQPREDWLAFLYSNAPRHDSYSERFRTAADCFHHCRDWDDKRLARQIREDGIDILVDLNGHTAGCRLAMLARQPASVQVAWIENFATTALPAVDYLLASPVMVPTEMDYRYTETIVRFPHDYVCYGPPPDAPMVGPPPFERQGCITFCCFNMYSKLTDATIALHAEVLKQVEESRIYYNTWALACAETRANLVAAFANHNIAPARIDIEAGGLGHLDFLGRYGRADIALDAIPFNGGLTTVEALWMGVPTVTVLGDRPYGRQSASHLINAGFGGLVAHDAREFVEIAVGLASDRNRLTQLRAKTRARMLAAPLMDAPTFAEDLANLWRWMRSRQRVRTGACSHDVSSSPPWEHK